MAMEGKAAVLIFLALVTAGSGYSSFNSSEEIDEIVNGTVTDDLNSTAARGDNEHSTTTQVLSSRTSTLAAVIQSSTATSAASGDISDTELIKLGDMLWAADHQRFPLSDLTINVSASGSLFKWVNETKLRTPSYALFIDLLDNYNPINNEEEPPFTFREQLEVSQFLEHVLSSDVMNIVEDVLVRAGKVSSSEDMKETLTDLWFDFYGRSPKLTIADSSGFEHVFVGEKKPNKINGFHSWIQMYELEKSGRLTYLGYNARQKPSLMDIRLEWDDLLKARASMFIGTSPEFDMALYTVCMLARPGRDCKTRIEGNDVIIQTYDISHEPDIQVATAFPKVRNPE